MVSKWDMKQCIKKHLDDFPYIYNEEEEALYSKDDGTYLCSLDTFLEVYRKRSGESFESIYYEHGTLENVIRCTECGTVIFTREDEDYDAHLKCPTCTDYKTYFEYWTKEDIESDEKADTEPDGKSEIEPEDQIKYKGFIYWIRIVKSIAIGKWVRQFSTPYLISISFSFCSKSRMKVLIYLFN